MGIRRAPRSIGSLGWLLLAVLAVPESVVAQSERPLPPAPGAVPLRTQVRYHEVRGAITPRFPEPRGFDPAELANLGAKLAPFDPELWSCTRRSGRAVDASVAAVLPAVFVGACFYEGYETLVIRASFRSTGFSLVYGGGYVPTSMLHRRRDPSPFHGALIEDGRLPQRIGREGDTVRFDDAASTLEGAREITPPPEAFLSTVGNDERWVYVDRDHQVLVAYVGRTPVMATLVSTGRPGRSTTRGEYRVVRKLPVGTMRDYDPGRGDRPYFIAGIPDIQYFNHGQAFHAAFWHDRFGSRQSHGCVNLSLADAQWLFDFTDPLPQPEGADAGRRDGAPSEAPASGPQGRDEAGSRVFVHGLDG